MDIDIRPLDPRNLPEVLEVLGRAFATQPSTRAIYRDAPDPARRIGIVFGAMFARMDGEVFVGRTGGSIVAAMRIVRWPNCQMKPLQGLAMLPALVRSGGPGTMRRGMKMRSTWSRHDPAEPHWHLDPLGVSPDVQGRGIGSRMMERYLQRVDETGLPAYHETDRPENVPFYERFGFEVVGQETIMDFRNWYMMRPATTRAGHRM